MVIHRLRRLLSFVRSRLPAYVFVWLVASSLLFTGASAIAQPQGGPPGGNPTGGGPPSEPPGLVRIGDILGDRSIDWNNPQQRARAVRRIREIEESQFQKARDIARQRGIPERQEFPDGTVIQLVGLDDEGEPFFHQTYNANAAISTGADILRASPYNLDGSGLTVGVWDGGEVRTTHQEFVGRVTLKNTGSLSDHATHVAGTIAAAGVVSAAKGMAPAIHVDSYYFSNIINEMNATGASAPDQFETKIYVSNHSYGPANMGWSGNRWYGTGTDNNAYNASFGRYDGTSSTVDGTAFNQPYHMMVYAAGNERNDNPSVNQQVTFDGENFFPYDPAIHPPGDGVYRNGFDNLGSYAVAKNTLTVGAVNDAVTDGLRDPSKATMSHFSSWGPADDGRIKPDVVGNGVGVYSPSVPQSGATDQSYSNKQGTSMAAPNVSGSAALLVQLYRNLFGQHAAMRASTLKGLLIHTATDLGTPGPNYSFGWGLVNVHKAAELIVDHHTDPSKERIREHFLSTSVPARSYEFEWDGSSPIRATLSWTDPAGTSTSGHDDRTSKLVNDLDLKIIAPNGDEYLPFVMPFVSLGDWNVENMSLPATTGTNSTDNVEQVFIENPGQAGTWQIEITHKGSLTNGEQVYSLLLSGMAGDPDLLVLQSITPDNGDIGTVVTVDIIGNALSEHTTIVLRRDGQPDISGVFVEMIGNTLRCNFNLSSVAWGAWDVVATNPDEQTFTLTQGFSVNPFIMVLFEEDFEASSSLPAGWSQEELVGTGASWKVQTGGRTGESSPLTAYSGSRNVTLFMSNNGDNIVRLHTPTLDLSGHADVVLQFQHHMEYWDPDQDELHIYYSANGGSSWSLLAEYTTSVTPWTLQEIMLPSPSANYVIAFEGNAKWGSGVCIDDVQILAYGEPEPTPATLSVTPAVGLSSSGVAGGPFDPASRVYTLTNAGSDPLDWEASKTEGWVSLSTSSGVLEPGASTTVTVSINSAAESLDVGTYSDTVIFTNTTNGEGNDTRAVSLSVLGPGTLVVTPEEDYTASGVEGGPFSPASKVYTLTNPGGEAIDWTVGKAATWLALSATSGTLAAEASTTVTVSIHSDADALPFAVYEDTITFVNTTNGNGNDTRDVTLTATEMVPDVPYGLTATSHIGRVDLVWEPSARAASYNVKRADVSSGPYMTIASQVGVTYSDFSATDVQAYFYVVSAVNSGGESADSAEAVAFVRHILPFVEDFEALAPGELAGQNGWEALDAVVQTDVSMSGQAAMITSEEGYVSQTIAGNETNVWTDIYYQPVLFDGEPGTPDADTTIFLAFNEDGNPMVYDGSVLLTFGDVSIATGAWVRVTMRSDYVAKTWDLYIDTDLVAEGLGFYDATAAHYREFSVTGAGSGTVPIDDIQIVLDSPFGAPASYALTVISAHGDPVPSAGLHTYDANALVEASQPVSVIEEGHTQYVVTGWAGTGSGLTGDEGTNVSFTITEDTTLQWQWQTNYWINFEIIGE